VSELRISIDASPSSDPNARSRTYRLGPAGTRFALPVSIRFPVQLASDEHEAEIWCQHSRLEDPTHSDVFDDSGIVATPANETFITCQLGRFSTISAVTGATFATYRGVGVAASALDACDQQGFSSQDVCTTAIGGIGGCSYCGGHNGCWIPGGGGHCCPGESGDGDDQCWLSFQTAPVGEGPDACGGIGFSSYDRCVNSGRPGIDCSYCGGNNGCWIPGGGGSCCPGESEDSASCYNGAGYNGGEAGGAAGPARPT